MIDLRGIVLDPEPELLLGPPGTGKTYSLLDIVEQELAAGTAPERVGFLSFTRRAADEARDRAMAKFSLGKTQLPWFRTLHSLCFAALGLNSADVFEGKKLSEFGDYIGVRVSGKMSLEEGTTFGFETGDRILFMENLARVKGITVREQYETDTDNLPWNVVDHVSRGLAKFKSARGLVDYTDMLSLFCETEWSARLEVLIVDEAQDLSLLQWAVVRKLAIGARRVVIAGDDDQSIYRWAGAATDHFVSLPGTERVLNRSFRVPSAVQPTALDLLGRIRSRREKRWVPREGDTGELARVASLDEVDFTQGDIMVLSRNTCFLRDDAAQLLRSTGIIFSLRGGSSVRSSLVQAILDWRLLRAGTKIPVASAEKIYGEMSVGEGYVRGHKKLPYWKDREAEVGMSDLREHGGLLADGAWHDVLSRATVEERAYMHKAMKRDDIVAREPRVKLSTIHGSKGGEADHIVLLTDMAWRTAMEARNNPEDEARVWYVAATRARKRLTIVNPQTRLERSYSL